MAEKPIQSDGEFLKIRSLNSSSWVRNWLRTQGIIYGIFVVVLIGFALIAPSFATMTSLLDILRITAVTTIIALGMTFVIIAAEIDLSIGAVVSFTGMVGALLLYSNFPWYLAALVTLLLGGVIGLLNGVITAYVGVPSFLVTLGSMEIFGGLAEMVTGSVSLPVASPGFISVFGDGPFLGVPVTIWWTVIVATLGYIVLHRTVFGRWTYATGGNAVAARFSGINVKRVKVVVFIVIGVLGSLGGLIFDARFTAGNPSVGNGMELDAIAAAILGGTNLFGGKGSIIGTVVGSIFIGAISVGLIMMGAGAELQYVIKGLIIIGVVALNSITKDQGMRVISR